MPHTTRRRLVAVVVVLAAAAVATTAAAMTGSHGRATAKAAVQLRKTALGMVLVDARGRTLYMFTHDRGGKSACYGGCAAAWPPLMTKTAKPTLGKGVRARLVGTTRRRDGKLQVTYAKHPLYTFAADKKAGDVTGQGYGGSWYVMSAAGKVIKKAASAPAPAPTTTTTPTTTSGGGGAWG